MQDLQRVRYVTKNYRELQGLRLAPLGLFLLLWGTIRWLGAPTWLTDSPVPFLLALIVGLFSNKIMESYYQSRFGYVEPDPERTRRERRWSMIGPLVAFMAIVLDEALQLQEIVVWLLWMTPVLAYMFIVEWPHRRFTIHRIIAGLFLVGVNALPLLGITRLSSYTLGLITIGLMLVIIGLIDHLLLVRTFKPVPEDTNGARI